MSSWHAVESWSTQESEPVYSQRGVFPESPCGENVYTDFTCPCWKCRYIKSRPPFECSSNPIRRGYKEEMERKAATHIQKIWRGFLVRNPTGIPTKEFTESIGSKLTAVISQSESRTRARALREWDFPSIRDNW